jgi:hypothetical protein
VVHCFVPGVQTGADGQEHPPQLQLAPHVCVPYVLHVSCAFGAQAPCPAHVPFCHEPFTHVCVSVPQLPQGTGFVVPGAHDPVHAPAEHVSPTHATALPHWPHASHVCTPLVLVLHCLAPGVHTGALAQEQGCHEQFVPHVCVPYVLHA